MAFFKIIIFMEFFPLNKDILKLRLLTTRVEATWVKIWKRHQLAEVGARDASAAKKTSLLIGKGRMQQKDGKEDHAGGKQLQKL